MSEPVKVTFVMELKEEAADAVCASFSATLPATRAFPGCRSVNAFRSADNPNRVLLLEEWDSREAYAKYLAWRNEDGTLDRMAEILAKPSTPEFWPIKLA
jgi:quinol monooxygenase YgiN